MAKVNFIITVEGGLVRDVLAYGDPEVLAELGDTEVIDFDTECMTEEEEAEYFDGLSVVKRESGEYELDVPKGAKALF